MANHVRVRPVRVKQHNPELGTDVLRCIGYQATEGQSWSGPIRKARPDAVQDATAHRNRTDYT